jgi:uncharacterized Fe-S cluster protein YjdI
LYRHEKNDSGQPRGVLIRDEAGTSVREIPQEVFGAMALEVTWDSKVCIHSGNCVKTLPQVFRVENGKFVIEPAKASDDRVRATVDACPSGALRVKE